MVEHRVIERMIAVIDKRLTEIERAGEIDPVFVDTAVDFIRTYADRTHHGKEEDILFRELSGRPLSAEDRRAMEELIEEHAVARRTTAGIIEANARYRGGDAGTLSDLAAGLKTLVDFYPKHIAKEDKIFFPAARTYFTDEEDQAMLSQFWEFDRKMIHEKYRGVVESLERI